MPAVTDRATFKDYCLDNKYTKWYFNIIERAISRGWNKKTSPVYVENHHIVPKSIIKNNDVVALTAREHFICHVLLTKMLLGTSKRKMMLALHRLTFGNKHNNIIYVKNAKAYENIKIKCSQFLSERSQEYWNNIPAEERTRMRSGENNSMFGKKQKESTKQLIGQKAKNRLKDKTKHPLYGIGHSEETKRQMLLNAPAKNYKFVFNDKKIDVFNLRKFCRDNNLDQGAMTRVNSGKQIQHKGFVKWQP
jgi:hypothetical protein